jgi:hypothetical protein
MQSQLCFVGGWRVPLHGAWRNFQQQQGLAICGVNHPLSPF